jgi:MraZ protein
MFEGTVSLSLDAKGRLAIPARYRDALATAIAHGPLVLTAHPDQCLWLLPLATWEPLRDKLNRVPLFDSGAQSVRRVMVGSQERLESLDSTGRILIPPTLREHAGLEKNVVLVGLVDYVEIWSEERHKQLSGQATQALKNGSPGLEGISL